MNTCRSARPYSTWWSGARVYNNYIYDNCQGANPKHVKGHSGWNRIWHNTFYGNHGAHIEIAVNEATGHEGPEPDCDYLDIRNNVFVRCGSTHIWNRPEIVGDNLTISHNLYFGPEGWPPMFHHTEWPRSGRPGLATLDEVRAQTPFGEGGRVADPQLIDPELGNLDYADTSPAAQGGADLDSPYGTQLGARGLRAPLTRFVRVGLTAIAASTNEDRMHFTTDGRYCTDWNSGEETTNQWIVYEVERGKPFTHLILTPVGHKVEFNVRHYEFAVSDDGEQYETILSGENNDSGSTFIYEPDEPISPRFLRFTMLDKFPDDGEEWTRNTITFDELTAGYCVPSLQELSAP